MPVDRRPAQAKQPSRKGKAAWRKHIDLTGVEASLENQRAAERVGLAHVNKDTAAAALFVEDRQGDEAERKRQEARRAGKAGKRPLKSLAVLQNASSIAPVQGRARRGVDAAAAARSGPAASSSSRSAAHAEQGGLTPEQRARRAGLRARDIEKLRRAAGRDVRGAFGAIVEDDDGRGAPRGPTAIIGDAYNVWDGETATPSAVGKGKAKARASATKTDAEWIEAAILKDPQVRREALFCHRVRLFTDLLPAPIVPEQLPTTLAEARAKSASLALPLEGQSYNPAAEEYEALLSKALQNAQSDEERLARQREFKRKWDEGALHARSTELADDGRILGMRVEAPGRRATENSSSAEGDDGDDGDDVNDDDNDDDDAEDDDEDDAPTRKLPKRKTKQQRARAQRRKEEEHAQAAAKAAKAARQQLQSLRALKSGLVDDEVLRAEQAAKRREAQALRAAERVGMRKLPKQDDDVQLGEDLSESLRELKVSSGRQLESRSGGGGPAKGASAAGCAGDA